MESRLLRVNLTTGELRSEVGAWQRLTAQAEDLAVLAELATEDEELAAELARESAKLEEGVAQFELDSTLSGPYDASDAILVVHSGEGGVDAQDCAEMLYSSLNSGSFVAHGLPRRLGFGELLTKALCGHGQW